MTCGKITLAVLMLAIHYAAAQMKTWTYANEPAWGDINKKCTEGNGQSPINITTEMAIADPRLIGSPLRYSGYSGKIVGTLKNNGRYVEFTLDSAIRREQRPRIWNSGYGTNGYVLQSIQLHWGWNSSVEEGSEHMINGRESPLEVQFIHYNGRYSSYEDAMQFDDALATVAFLFEATNDAQLVSSDYAQFATQLGKAPKEDTSSWAVIDFDKILPGWTTDGSGVFYRYSGSMTSPPCSEVVSWTVYEKRVYILESTLTQMMNAVGGVITWVGNQGNYATLQNNYRSTQDSYGRQIRTNRWTDLNRDAAMARLSQQQRRDPSKSPFLCWGTLLCLPNWSQ